MELDAPAIISRCAVTDVAAFVGEFGECVVQESRHVGPAEFTLTRLREFWDDAREQRPAWAIDAPLARYIFHDNLVRARDPGSVVQLRPFFARYPASTTIAVLSKRCPCVAQVLTCGGPNSGTPVPHTHGTAELHLLASTKEWWFWPPQSAALFELVMRGAQATNRLEYWLEHVAPLFEGRSGDVTELVLQSLRDLMRRRLLIASPPREVGEVSTYIAACQRMQTWRSERRGIIAEHYRPTTVVQRAGETIIVPEGYPHAVRNLDWHLAVIYELLLESVAEPLRRTA